MSNPTGKRRLKAQNCKSASSVSMAKENVKSAVSAQGPVVQSHDSTKPSPLVQARPIKVINGQGIKMLYFTVNQCLPSHPTKDGRATDSTCGEMMRPNKVETAVCGPLLHIYIP